MPRARIWPTKPTTARIVTTYGSMSMNSLGIGVFSTVSRFCRLVAKPNSSAASVAASDPSDRR
jgi:hypothetical protein